MNTIEIQTMLDDLRNDNMSGASELIEKALNIIRKKLESISDLNKNIINQIISLSKKIINSQPSMAPLINAIGYLIHDLKRISKSILQERIKGFYNDQLEREEALSQSFNIFLRKIRKVPLKIMLISYSSTIINQLIANKDYDIEIFILESRPLLEGIRVAEILSSYFITHLIIDAAMGKFIDQVDLILIGVDSILTNGSIINKIGTLPLSVLAYERNVGIYAVGDLFKYNLNSYYGKEVIVEEKPTKELYSDESQKDLLKIHKSDLGVLKIEEFIKLAKENLPLDWYKEFL
jgi:translation initiation factor 2B subunit (eIF-2B alpha/beta/delta family)